MSPLEAGLEIRTVATCRGGAGAHFMSYDHFYFGGRVVIQNSVAKQYAPGSPGPHEGGVGGRRFRTKLDGIMPLTLICAELARFSRLVFDFAPGQRFGFEK